MSFLKNIFPGNQIKYSADKGYTTTERSGGPMRSLFVENKDVIVEPAIATEQPTVEKVVSKTENAIEKNKEMIERSFSQVFSKDNNRDIMIFSQKKDCETKIGTYLNNAFFPGNALYVLKEMFFAQHKNDNDLKEENIENVIKQFCLENVDSIKCNSDEMRTAVKAVCNKGEESVLDKIEKKDEQEVVDLELNKKLGAAVTEGEGLYEAYEEKISEIFAKSEFALDTEKAEMVRGKMVTIMAVWNDILERYEDNNERTDELLADSKELKKNAENLVLEVSSWKVAVDTKEKTKNGEKKEKKNENTEQLFEKAIERVDKIKNFRIERIGRGEEVINAIEITDVTDVKVQNMQKEEKNKLAIHIKRANGAIMTAQEELTKEKKPLAEKVETKSENMETKPEDEEDKNKIIAEQFRAAAGLVEKSALSREEFEEQYDMKLSNKVINKCDMEQSLLKYADIIEGDHEDAVAKKLHETFWDNYDEYLGFVGRVNDLNSLKKMIVIEGVTYVVEKDLKEAEQNAIDSGKEIEAKIEGLPDMVVEFFVKGAKKLMESTDVEIASSDDYMLLNSDERFLQVENFVKIFIRKDLAQKKVALVRQYEFNDEMAKKVEEYILGEIFKK